MRALVKAKPEPGIWMADVAMPTIGPNDVLIRMKKTAICGTDMHIFNWDAWAQKSVPVPMAVGHEYSGEIVEIGSEVRGFNAGDRVSGEGHITCGHCRNCRAGRRHLCRNTLGVGVNRAGAFAEYLTIPATNVFKLTPAIDDEIAWIGSSNMDIRSFALNAEVVLLAYDPKVCAQVREVQERYFREGVWLDAAIWGAQPLWRQVGWNLARLFSSLL